MLLEGVLSIIVIFFIYHKYSFYYWKQKNVFSPKGELLFGNVRDVLFGQKTLIELFTEYYEKYKTQRLIGFYSFYRPMLLIYHPDIIRDVLVKYFHCFADNGFRIFKTSDPMFGINPFCTTGLENWKKVRGIHAPFHTPVKLKEMFPIMKRVGHNLVQHIKENVSQPQEIMELTGLFTMENVLTCAYGLEPQVFSNPQNAFMVTSEQLFTSSNLANFSALFFPSLAKILPLRIISKKAEELFLILVKSMIDFKSKTGSHRNDLINQLMNYHQKKLAEGKRGLTDLEFAGHSITMYVDGYATSSSALSIILLEIANHPEVQEKLRTEILSAGSTINDFDYEKINSLPYLAMTINESLRMHPLLPVLTRECTQSTEICGVKIDKGTKVFIPVKCIHYDPNYYPEPLTFDPERFADESKIHKGTFLPFGDGPRMCLGFKFALLQLKIAMISILLNFKILTASGEEKQEIKYDENATFVVEPKHDTKLKFQLLC